MGAVEALHLFSEAFFQFQFLVVKSNPKAKIDASRIRTCALKEEEISNLSH